MLRAEHTLAFLMVPARRISLLKRHVRIVQSMRVVLEKLTCGSKVLHRVLNSPMDNHSII